MTDKSNDVPANRFNELPAETQKFLSRLDEEDIKLLEEGLVLVRSTLTVGRFMKWLMISTLAMIVGVMGLYEWVAKGIAWIQGPR